MERVPFPGDLSELDFLRAYVSSTLRKPQVVSDSVLRTLVLAGQFDRVLLVAALAEQLAEACRRLVHVVDALEDRTHPVARTLSGPLPGLEGWVRFAQLAASTPPDALVRRLGLDSAAVPHAERLRQLGDFSFMTAIVAAGSSGNPMVLVRSRDGRPAAAEFDFAAGGGTNPTGFVCGADDADGAALADLTADVSAVARGFLGSYLDARVGAGRRD